MRLETLSFNVASEDVGLKHVCPVGKGKETKNKTAIRISRSIVQQNESHVRAAQYWIFIIVEP